MKLPRKKRDEASATLTSTLGLILGCSVLLMLSVYASDPASWNDPSWWSARGAVLAPVVVTNSGVVTTNYIANNNAVVSQGQVKQFTARAVDELNAHLPGGASPALTNLVYGWKQDYLTNGYNATNLEPSDYTVMNVGQLKYIASLVYGRLAAAGYTGLTPSWIVQNTNTDHAAANLGQLKEVFNFNLTAAANAPGNLVAVASSNPGEIDLSWTPPSVNNATSYTLSYSTNGGTTWTTLTTTGNPSTSSFAATGLDPTQQYQFSLSYNNSNSTASNAGSSAPITTPQTAPPVPAPRYAVIDMGTNMYPMKITSSGYVLENSRGGPNYLGQFSVWYNGQTTPLQPNNASDAWYASDIDKNGRVVGAEGPGGSGAWSYDRPSLAVWLPGQTTPSLTAPPQFPDFLDGSGYAGYISNILVSPTSIWSVQGTAVDLGDIDVAIMIVNGFSGSTELGSLSAQPSTNPLFSPDMQYTLGTLTGTEVNAVAANDSDQAIIAHLGNFLYYSPTPTIPVISDYEVQNVSYTLGQGGPAVPFVPLNAGINPGIPPAANEFVPVANVNQGILSNVSALGKTYVLGSDTTLNWNEPANFAYNPTYYSYSTPTKYYVWDGTTTYTLPQPAGSGLPPIIAPGNIILGPPPSIAPACVNAATATIQSGTNSVVVPATQIVGNGYDATSQKVYGCIWQMNPPSTNAPGFGNPQKLDNLIPTNSGWSLSFTNNALPATSINDSGAIVGTATYSGTNSAIAAGPHGVELIPVQVNHADGTNQDMPMAYVPQWTPNNGSGRGQPIYHTPTPVLQMSSIGTTMAATFLGQSSTLTQNGSNPLLYQNTTSGLSILLSAAPLNDPSVQESLQATVNLSSAGISNGIYTCNETTASSNVFQDVTPGIGIALAGLNPASADTMTLSITGDTFSNSVTLTETGANTLTFSGSGITVQLVNSSTVGGTLYAALTYSAYGYSNTVMPIGFVSAGQYQNFAPPTSTDQTPESVDSFASFYIQLPAGLGSTPSVDLTTQVSGSDVDFGTVNLVSTGNNMWRSAKKLVLLSAGADTSQMTSADSSNFQTLQLPAGANLDWTKGGGIINVLLNGVGAVKPQLPVKAQANGVALESLNFFTWAGQGVDVENRIRLPLVGMGYTMDSDYSATTPKTLSTYVTGGKQIWYSMSHGNTYDPSNDALTGTPNAPFTGLTFKDATTITGAVDQGVITATRLPAGLNYRLVICDGCSSAQTSLDSKTASQNANTLLSNCSTFANAFGPNVAYVGWSWEIEPTLQQFTGQFVNNLQGKGVTVQSAYQKFLNSHPPGSEANELKIYGNVNAIIDLNSNPNATTSSGTSH